MLKSFNVIGFVVMGLSFTACNLPGSTAGAAAPAGSSGGTSGGSSGGSGSTPTYGFSCSTNGGGGSDNIEAANVFPVPSLTGNFLNSVVLTLTIKPTASAANLYGTTYSTPLYLDVYTCSTTSPSGSPIATATVTTGLNGADKEVTFTYSTPVAIPGSGACSGTNPLVFKLRGTANMSGYALNAYSLASGGSCTDVVSSNSYRAWKTTITASQ